MRSLRWVGLAFSLLIVGVLGGLMAPLPSEAHPPTLTLQVDNGNPLDILNYGGSGDTPSDPHVYPTCTAGELALGYNFCYSVKVGDTLYTGTPPAGVQQRSFKVQDYDGSTHARLLIADRATQGTTNGDLITLSGVKFVPYTGDGISWPTTERHILRVKMENIYNLFPGTTGTYVFYLRTAGVFDQLADPDAIGDQIYYTGEGRFDLNTDSAGSPKHIANGSNPEEAAASPEAAHDNCRNNPAKEKFCVGSGGAPLDYPALVQGATLPSFPCNNRSKNLDGTTAASFTYTFTSGVPGGTPSTYSYNNPKCTPFVSATMRFTFFGPDGVKLATSNNQGSKKCKTDTNCDNAEQDLLGLGDELGGAEPVFTHAQNCPAAVCNAAVKIMINVSPPNDASGKIFNFDAVGPFGLSGPIDIPVGNNGNGDYPPFTNLFTRDPDTGVCGPGWEIDAGNFPVLDNTHHWEINVFNVTSVNGTTPEGPEGYERGVSGSTKTPLIIHCIANADELDVTINLNSKKNVTP
jgi:hypothetical protein